LYVNQVWVRGKMVMKLRGWYLVWNGWSWVETESWLIGKVFYPPLQVFYPIYVWLKNFDDEKKDIVCNVEREMVWNVERKCRVFEKMDSVP